MSEAWRLESRCSVQKYAVLSVVTEVKIHSVALRVAAPCNLIGGNLQPWKRQILYRPMQPPWRCSNTCPTHLSDYTVSQPIKATILNFNKPTSASSIFQMIFKYFFNILKATVSVLHLNILYENNILTCPCKIKAYVFKTGAYWLVENRIGSFMCLLHRQY
jgi:hypothetical protein